MITGARYHVACKSKLHRASLTEQIIIINISQYNLQAELDWHVI